MPARPIVSDDKILEVLKRGLTLAETCKELDILPSGGSYNRVVRLARAHNIPVRKAYPSRVLAHEEKRAEQVWEQKLQTHARQHLAVGNGTVIVASDAHYWPGSASTAHRALLRLCGDLRPVAVVMNGDGFDGATISRFPRIGWDRKPTVQDELQACKARMGEIEEAAGTKSLFWPLGNHDSRFETFLAAKASEYEGVEGFQLKSHFPLWRPCWALWINNDVIVKHRIRNGIHATHNNALWSGKTTVTGHLHSQKVTPITDYNGTRWGVDCGCVAAVGGPQFVDYTEDNPLNWRSGFAVLTFWNGQLLDPEFVRVMDEDAGRVVFRGQVIDV